MQQRVTDVIEQFEKLKQSSLEEAVASVSHDESVQRVLHLCLRSQTNPDDFMQPLFEWLYKCVQHAHSNIDLFNFVVQFVPDVVLVYLQAVYESQTQLKASAEVLLLAIIIESEKNKLHTIQVPSLSKPSLYHQSPVQISQSVLTEAALQRHDQSEASPPRRAFSGKEVTVNNRLLFLSAVIDIFVDSLTVISPDSRIVFCDVCIRLAMQGMCGSFMKCFKLDQSLKINIEMLSKMKRFSVSDPVIVSLLRGVRICLFQSCHNIAVQALLALKLRAQYELLTVSIQISHVLSRALNNVRPEEAQLDPKKLSNYSDAGTQTVIVDPQEVHRSLNSSILYYKLCSTEVASNDMSVSEMQKTGAQLKTISRITSV